MLRIGVLVAAVCVGLLSWPAESAAQVPGYGGYGSVTAPPGSIGQRGRVIVRRPVVVPGQWYYVPGYYYPPGYYGPGYSFYAPYYTYPYYVYPAW